jgi:hypothetical protein
VQITKRLHRDPRRADSHIRANDRIEHPCRHDNRRAGFSFNEDHIGAVPLLGIKSTDRTAVERMPAVVDRHFLPDTGRITA